MRYRKPHVPSFKTIASAIKRAALKKTDELLMEFAGEECERFRQRILHQDFKSFHDTPLSPAWLARKAAAHRDLRTMIATGFYVDHIKVFRQRNEDGSLTIRIGFHPSALARNLEGQTVPIHLYEIAQIHENGSAAAQIPARPHWRPHLNEMRHKAVPMRKVIAGSATKAVNQELQRTLK